LAFRHPVSREEMEFEAEMPVEFSVPDQFL
jgi:hypothetical protein